MTASKADDCRNLVKKEQWQEALQVCPAALASLPADDPENDSERYHLLLAHAKALLHSPTSGQLVSALNQAQDLLQAAIQLKPALTGPYLQRAECSLKQGDFASARRDLERFDESPRLAELLRSVDRAEAELRLALTAQKEKKWRQAAERASSLLKNYSPASVEAREILEQALLAMEDRKRAVKLLVPEVMDSCFLARFYFASGDFDQAKVEAGKCETGDGKDSSSKGKDSGKMDMSQIAQVAKEFTEAESMLLRPSIAALEALQKRLEAFSTPPPGPLERIRGLLCLKYAKVKNSEAAVKLCRECLKTASAADVVDYSLSLSEALQQQEQFDEAVSVLEECARQHRDSRLKEALKAAQKARHDAANPDYYKLLDVPRDASDKQIKLAYRRLAQKYHPDKMKQASAEEKRRAELRMGLINRANDVLTDPEKRAQYDRGFDPENPQGHAQGPGGFHFGGGGGAGGGVPFEFIFEALRQQQAGGGGSYQHQQRRRQQQHHQQFHFNFHDEL